MEPILQALNNWGEYDSYRFVNSMQERYKPINIKSLYLEELEAISQLILGLPNLICKFQHSRKCAILFELKVTLEDIKKRLEAPIDN